jgi:RNA polymerase sigma-70 factor (ECF subfamily)
MRPPSIDQLAFAYISSRDEKDFKNLFDRLRPGLVNYSNKILHDDGAAEDVVTDAFVKIWSKIDMYDARWCFSTWCYKIVYNETMQYIRKQRKTAGYMSYSLSQGEPGFIDLLLQEAEKSMGSAPADFSEFDTRELTVEEVYDKVMVAIEQLPEHYRDIIIDQGLTGMKYADIAKKYGLEINTVKTRIIRAREKVCEQLQISRNKLTKII